MVSRTERSWVRRYGSRRWVEWVVLGSVMLSLLIYPAAVRAQDTIPQAENRSDTRTILSEIIVTATRTPESIFDVPQTTTVVDSGTIEKTQVRSVGEVVRTVPGVTVSNGAPRRLGQSLNIRGLTQEQVVVRRDGARIGQFSSGHKGNLFFDLGSIKSVEVLQGPSALYGSGGLGGIVSFETYDPADYLAPDDSLGTRLNYSYSDAFGEHTGRVKTYGRTENQRFSWLLGLTARDADRFVDLASDEPSNPDRLDFAEEQVINPHGKLIFEPGEVNRVELSIDSYDNEGLTLSNLDDVSADSNAYVNRTTENRSVTLNYDRNGTNWWDQNVRASAYYNAMELTDRRLDNGSEESGTRDDIEFTTLGLDVQNTVNQGIHEITYGLEHVVDDQSSATTRDPGANANAFFPDAEQSKSGLYVQDKLSFLADRLTVIPAVRFDAWENKPDSAALETRTEDETSLQVGSVLELTDRWKLTAAYSEGFRAPTIQELYNRGLHFSFMGGPITFQEFFVPNPDLKPETSQNMEVGVRYVTDRLKARVSYYEIDAEDLISQVLVNEWGSPPPFTQTRERQAQNIARAELFGIEGMFEWSLWSPLNLWGRYSNPHGRDVSNNQPLGSIPAETLVLGAEWEDPDRSWVAGVTGQVYDDQDNTPNGIEASGYTLYDVYVQWKPWKSTRLNLTVNNLTDNEYTNAASGRPGTGRDFRAGLTYVF